MTDEVSDRSGPDVSMPLAEWEREKARAARARAARWAAGLIAAHPELAALIPPERRFLYVMPGNGDGGADV
jgi:hypothetical protein